MSRNATILPRSIVPFEDTVSARGAKITWAVIPHRLIESQSQDDNVVNELIASKQNGNEIAQHGYNHQCPICGQYNHEMWCSQYQSPVSREQQESLISAGLQILEDSLQLHPTTFVPPGHAADTTTYHLLKEQGFSWISTTGPTQQDIYPGLYNLSPNNEYTWALTSAEYESKLEAALQDIRAEAAQSGYYCLYYHDYFIRQGYENGIVLQWTAELLDSIRAEYGQNVRFMTLDEAARTFTEPITNVQNVAARTVEKFRLYPNYPNPFNPATTINYSLPNRSRVAISIYNAKGQLIQKILDAQQSAGEHTFLWNAHQLSAGVYFYRVQSANAVQVGKAILLK